MERREFIAAIGTVAAAFASQEVMAQESKPKDMHPPKYKDLEESASKCVATGEDCLRHCIGMFAMKETAMAACARSVTELIAACRALQTLASVNSSFTRDYAKTTAKVCAACETECAKFPDVAECVACGNACKKCAEECNKLA